MISPLKLFPVVAAGLSAALLVSCSSVSSKSEPKAVKLFNGKNLANWSAVLAQPDVRKEAVWSVREGNLICKGEPLGYLRTDQSFTNFRLTLEYRWSPGSKPGNSGVFLRINGQPSPLPRGIECQLKDGSAGDLYGFHGFAIDGPAARRSEVKHNELAGDFVGVKKMAGAERKPGEWNWVEILAKGSDLTVWLNGSKINEATGCEVIAGPIGLQSEGGEIHFRSVRIIPLEP